MSKITEPGYQLPNIMALSAFNVFHSGTTEPMAINGVDMQNGNRGQYVVKFKNANRMSLKSSARELLGAWMALQLDIHCVTPVLVNITNDFVKTITGKQGYTAALQSVGYNFGSVYMPGYQLVPTSGFHFSDSQRQQAQLIFMFDMLINNADRGAGKPNVLSNGEKLLVFDHELAFSFVNLLSFARNPKPWVLGPLEQELYKQHYFYNLLKGSVKDFITISETLNCFDNEFWEKVDEWMPKDWNTEELQIIRKHVSSIVENKEEFAMQLNLILAT